TREDIIGLLKQNTNLSEEKLEEYADTIMQAFSNIQDTFSKENLNDFTENIERRIKAFLNIEQNESFDVQALKREFVQLINHPSEAFDAIKNTVTNYNRKDFEVFLVKNNLVS